MIAVGHGIGKLARTEGEQHTLIGIPDPPVTGLVIQNGPHMLALLL